MTTSTFDVPEWGDSMMQRPPIKAGIVPLWSSSEVASLLLPLEHAVGSRVVSFARVRRTLRRSGSLIAMVGRGAA